jgi:hypothetical protein
MRFRSNFVVAAIAAGVGLATPAWAGDFFFSTGNADGLLGALSRSESPGKIQTETADDFVLTQTTIITGATIVGLVNAPLANISNVEVELYNKFPLDSVIPPSGRVLSRVNSPADVEIDSATRDASVGTLRFAARQLSATFAAQNTVVHGINPNPSKTGGEGATTGTEVEVTITFAKPILLPAGQYFFRPEVLVTGGDFLYLSAPRPIVAPGTPISGDLQAWIRNDRLAPDWVRIGTDVIGGATPPTFNMTFSLAGDTIPGAGIPGDPSCHGDSIAALARQFGGIRNAASVLGFSSVAALQESFREFCNP